MQLEGNVVVVKKKNPTRLEKGKPKKKILIKNEVISYGFSLKFHSSVKYFCLFQNKALTVRWQQVVEEARDTRVLNTVSRLHWGDLTDGDATCSFLVSICVHLVPEIIQHN